MTNSCGGDPERFRDVTIGHGLTRDDAVADARSQCTHEVVVMTECEIAGTWTVLVRAAPVPMPAHMPAHLRIAA